MVYKQLPGPSYRLSHRSIRSPEEDDEEGSASPAEPSSPLPRPLFSFRSLRRLRQASPGPRVSVHSVSFISFSCLQNRHSSFRAISMNALLSKALSGSAIPLEKIRALVCSKRREAPRVNLNHVVAIVCKLKQVYIVYLGAGTPARRRRKQYWRITTRCCAPSRAARRRHGRRCSTATSTPSMASPLSSPARRPRNYRVDSDAAKKKMHYYTHFHIYIFLCPV